MARTSKLFVSIMALLLASATLSYAFTSGVAGLSDDGKDEIELTSEGSDEQGDEEAEADEAENEKDDDEAEEGDEGKPEKSPKAKKARSTEGCSAGFTGNHGQFVSSSEDKQAAARSDCGKPVKKDKPEKEPKADKPDKEAKPDKEPKAGKKPKAPKD